VLDNSQPATAEGTAVGFIGYIFKIYFFKLLCRRVETNATETVSSGVTEATRTVIKLSCFLQLFIPAAGPR
jgi:hypothetical protein